MSSAASSTPANSVRWVKSTHSGPTGGNCVEVAALGDGQVAVRDSVCVPVGPAVVFPAREWAAFTRKWQAPAPGR
jgi:hypothetical protein